MTTTTTAILALDLGKYKSVARLYDPDGGEAASAPSSWARACPRRATIEPSSASCSSQLHHSFDTRGPAIRRRIA